MQAAMRQADEDAMRAMKRAEEEEMMAKLKA